MANRFFPNYDTYLITSRFGMRTLRGQTRMHNGIDLVAKTSAGGGAVDKITAHTGGRVTISGYDNSAGYMLKIQTAPNVAMVYYHLREQSPFKVGDVINTGAVIGYMGATGNVTGAHLHFGIQVNGAWVDPEPWLDRNYDGTQTEPVQMCNVQLPVLYRGLKVDQVKLLQLLLNNHLGATLEIDGSFGPATEAAVEKFQGEKSLEKDKRVGPKTWVALLNGIKCEE